MTTQKKKAATSSIVAAPMRTATFGTMPAAKPSTKKAKPAVINIKAKPAAEGEGMSTGLIVGLLVLGWLLLGD
jgi:hypothetical protein